MKRKKRKIRRSSILSIIALIFTLISLVMALLNFYSVLNYMDRTSHLEPVYIQDNIVTFDCKRNITKEIEDIALNVSNQTFINNVHDCSEFSKDLVIELRKINISAYCVSGFSFDGEDWGGHTWVEVLINNQTYPIESTGGYYIDGESYSLFYKKRLKGYCL